MKVLAVGDAILDRYQYVTPLNKASKEYLIPVRLEGQDSYNGGVLAVASQVRAFTNCDMWHPAEITTKTRYVDRIYGVHIRKLFETHERDPLEHADMPDTGPYDLVMVSDFGIGDDFSKVRGKYTAVCAQMNSTNYGYPSLKHYAGVELVVMNELEARMAAQDRESPVEALAQRLAAMYLFGTIVITEGHRGALGYDVWRNEFAHQPGLGGRVLDTMGAGDTLFAWVAPLLAAGSPLGLALKVGSLAAGLKCQHIGQRVITEAEVLGAL